MRNGALAFIAVNLPFLYFFYDAFNLNDSLFGASLLYLGIGPYNPSLGSTVAAGYPILPFNHLAFAVYWLTGFNLVATAIAMKLVLLLVTYLAAFVLLRIARLARVREWKVLYYSFLLNPFLIFVNDIWVETDVLVFFAILIGYYSIRYGWNERGSFASLLVGATAVLWAGYAYYWPILLVPALLVYSTSVRKLVTSSVVIIGLGVLYSIPVVFFGLNSLAVRGLVSGNLTNPYSILALFTPIGFQPSALVTGVLLTIAGAVALLLPIGMRHFGVDLAVTILSVFIIDLVLIITLAQADNFVILVGLTPLALIYCRKQRITYALVFALESALVPLFWIVQMWNGPGLVSGVYYWAFPVLHQDVDLYQLLGGLTVWKACLAAYILLLACVVVYFSQAGKSATPVRISPSTGVSDSPRPNLFAPPRPISRRRAVGVLIIVGLLVVGPLVFSAVPGQSYSLGSAGGFPDQLFIVHDFDTPTLYLMPAPDTFSVDPGKGTLTIPSTGPSMAFIRQLQGQYFDVNFSAQLSTPSSLTIGSPIAVANATGIETGFERELSVPMGLAPLIPVQSSNLTVQAGSPGVVSNITTTLVSNGSGVRTYSIDPVRMEGDSLVFAARMSRYAASQNLLWDITENGTTILESYFVGQSFYLASFVNDSWVSSQVGTPILPNNWFITGISLGADNGTLTAWADGLGLSLSQRWDPNATYYLYVAKFGPSDTFDGKYALIGGLTELYQFATSSLTYVCSVYVAMGSASSPVFSGYGSSIDIDFSGTPSQGVLQVENRGFDSSSTNQVLEVGKLADGDIGLQFSFHQVDFRSLPSPPTLPWILTEFAVSPVLASVAWFFASSSRRLFPVKRGLREWLFGTNGP